MQGITVENCTSELLALLTNSEKYDGALIRLAIDMACKAHEGQFRRSGEPYVCHPLRVARIVAELGMDTQSICAALLHDVVEDTAVELAQLRRDFGEEVAAIVDGVTKLEKLDFATHEEEQAENVRKMLLAMSRDIRVIIIKLADRLHNMRTISAQPPKKQLQKAHETMEIYAPLAHRLGMRALKEELEDLSLRTLDPIGYAEIEKALEMHAKDRAAFLNIIQTHLREHLDAYHIKCYLTGRVKSIPGIYRKMYMQGHSFDEIYDVYAVRVIVDTVGDCYNVLGIVHEMYHMLPNRFKDYISTPKSNMYQSLHTTVIGKEKIPFEVQIRTWDMHYTAEYGIAAHWKYKLGLRGGKDSLEDRLNWVRQLLENPTDNPEEVLNSIKTDLSTDDVFVFTPKGDVIILPQGSTPVDFAYAIHSAVGNRMTGAKVDGRIVQLGYTLKMGEIVEVITASADSAKGPSRDWLNIVKTSEARNKIRAWFKKERREENIERGRLDLEREFARNFIRIPDDKLEEFLLVHAKRQHFTDLDEFYAAIGYGGLQLSKIMPHIKDEYQRQRKESTPPQTAEEVVSRQAKPVRSPHSHNGGVVVEGMENCLVKFSRCCNPLPGDEVVGFITRGYGVSVHKCDCTNVPADIAASPEAARWVKVHWEEAVRAEFKATLYITAKDRRALLADVSTQLAAMHVSIHSLNVPEPKDDRAIMILTVGVNNVEHLRLVIDRLRKIPDVISIERNSGR